LFAEVQPRPACDVERRDVSIKVKDPERERGGVVQQPVVEEAAAKDFFLAQRKDVLRKQKLVPEAEEI
jgi:hypothetical protein